jgi:hypothetical protein
MYYLYWFWIEWEHDTSLFSDSLSEQRMRKKEIILMLKQTQILPQPSSVLPISNLGYSKTCQSDKL